MQKRRKYSTEFKQEVVQLASAPGVSRSQVAMDLGINAGMLARWCDLAPIKQVALLFAFRYPGWRKTVGAYRGPAPGSIRRRIPPEHA